MLKIQDVWKSYGNVAALRGISMEIGDGEIWGLIGSNGAGKSTLMGMLSGVMQPESGCMQVDGMDIFEHPQAKEQICYLPDSCYYPANADIAAMQRLYQMVYPAFNMARFYELIEKTGLPRDRKVQTYSKGMKRQLSVLLGICCGTRYLLCDELFDGLDPAARQRVKRIFAMEMLDRPFTAVIASHNLRELEDICDHVGLLHEGKLILSQDLDSLQRKLQKIQCVLPTWADEEKLLRELDIVKAQKQRSLLLLVARGSQDEVMGTIEKYHPIFAETLPLTLEEIFITETEAAGYGIEDISC